MASAAGQAGPSRPRAAAPVGPRRWWAARLASWACGVRDGPAGQGEGGSVGLLLLPAWAARSCAGPAAGMSRLIRLGRAVALGRNGLFHFLLFSKSFLFLLFPF